MADADADADADGRFIEFNLHKNFEMAGYEKVAIPSSHPVVFVRVSFSDMWFDMQSLYKESEVRVERERERERESEREKEREREKFFFTFFEAGCDFYSSQSVKAVYNFFSPNFPIWKFSGKNKK